MATPTFNGRAAAPIYQDLVRKAREDEEERRLEAERRSAIGPAPQGRAQTLQKGAAWQQALKDRYLPQAAAPQFNMEEDAASSSVLDTSLTPEGNVRVPAPRMDAGTFAPGGQPVTPSAPAKVTTGRTSSQLSGLEKERQSLSQKGQELQVQKLEADAAHQREVQRLDQQASDNETKRLQAEADEAAKVQEADAKSRGSLDAEMQSEMQAFKEMSENPPGLRVDPNGWWNNSDTAGKIGIVIAAAMQGLAAIGGVRSNVIGDIIERDIDAQKSNIQAAQTEWQRKLAAKHTLVGMIDSKVNNLDKSAAIAKSFMLDRSQREARRLAAAAKGDEAKANGVALEQQLELGKQGIAQRYAESELDLRTQRAQKAAAATARLQKEAKAAELAGQAIAGGADVTVKEGGVTARFNSPDNKKVSEGSMKLEETRAAVDTVLDDLKGLPSDTTVPTQGNIVQRGYTAAKESVLGPAAVGRDLTPEQRRLDLARNTGLGLLAQARNSGVINPSEAPALEKQLNGGPREMEQALVYLARQTSARRTARGD